MTRSPLASGPESGAQCLLPIEHSNFSVYPVKIVLTVRTEYCFVKSQLIKHSYKMHSKTAERIHMQKSWWEVSAILLSYKLMIKGKGGAELRQHTILPHVA